MYVGPGARTVKDGWKRPTKKGKVDQHMFHRGQKQTSRSWDNQNVGNEPETPSFRRAPIANRVKSPPGREMHLSLVRRRVGRMCKQARSRRKFITNSHATARCDSRRQKK
jgi:hypothetical protein